MLKMLIILLAALVFEAIGLVLLSRGLKQIGEPDPISVAEILRCVKGGATNGNILLGVFFEALFFGLFLVLLSRADVSFVLPLMSLGLVLTTFCARWILGEHVSPLRWTGVVLIVVGSSLVTYSQKAKDRPGAKPEAGRGSEIRAVR